jgi:hypothetical protein
MWCCDSSALVVAGAVVFMMACSSRSAGPPGGAPDDRGPFIGIDGGAPSPDASSLPGDAGTSEPPLAADAGGTDAPAIPEPACDEPPAAFLPELTPRCAAETVGCLALCEDAPCMIACLDADDTEPVMMGVRRYDCSACIRWQQKVCIDRSGCHAETAALQCCVETHCPDASCTATACAAENTAWETCARETATPCLGTPNGGEYYGVCFSTDYRTETCTARHGMCFRHEECCPGAGACTSGYCDGPERPTSVPNGGACWAHGLCESGTCGPDGVCVLAAPPDHVCIADRLGCWFDHDCCSGACRAATSTCATSGRGTWLD